MTNAPTGDLLRVQTWWHEQRPGPTRVIAWITDPTDAADAQAAVDRAVDSGATLIALVASGNDAVARATICAQAKVTPVQVRDQVADMSDVEWMSQVAAIRDVRAAGDPQDLDPAIQAAARVLLIAKERTTPVIFDGLTAYAGAMSIGALDPSWLPASSSTDPAIEVAQNYWRVQPAVDLHLRSDDDLGVRAVIALLNLVDAD